MDIYQRNDCSFGHKYKENFGKNESGRNSENWPPKRCQTLEQKRLQVEKERRELKAEQARLDALKKEIDGKLAKLTEMQTAIQGELDKKKVIQDARLKHLIKIYTTMPPKKAAMLIDKLEMEVIIALFSSMKGDIVGQILPNVSPEKAAEISERLAKLRH